MTEPTPPTQSVAEETIAPSEPSEPNEPTPQPEEILCLHCLRTTTNGIKCQGICVADNGY